MLIAKLIRKIDKDICRGDFFSWDGGEVRVCPLGGLYLQCFNDPGYNQRTDDFIIRQLCGRFPILLREIKIPEIDSVKFPLWKIITKLVDDKHMSFDEVAEWLDNNESLIEMGDEVEDF